MNDLYTSFHNQLVMERNIVSLIEKTNIAKPGFDFSSPNIIQAVIQTNLYYPPQNIPLRTIYRSFVCSPKFPYIQLLLAHEAPERRVYSRKGIPNALQDKIVLISNWFRSTAYGRTIKMVIEENKYVSITISENSRLYYKIQYKESDDVAIDDVQSSMPFVIQLIEKINSEANIGLPIPKPDQFRFAFINSSQKFKVPSGITLDHNTLSDFGRYFYPYVAVVVDPKKRQTTTNESGAGKWGTYLRYKKVSNYGDTATIQRRVVHYLRNFIITDNQLVSILENEFNMTKDDAIKHVKHVLEFINIKRSAILKPVSMTKNIKPSGIGIEIQGKSSDCYKIRVIGSRNKDQMNDIYRFLNRMIILYYGTHIKKTKSPILETLISLTGIAKRKNLVRDVVLSSSDSSNRDWTREYDADKISNTHSYTRQCQNSGDEIRWPKPIIGRVALQKLGYSLNKSTGVFEKRIEHPETGQIVTQVAIKIFQDDKEIFYICDASIHKNRVYPGILSKSDPPLPCCFKKNQLTSKTEAIRKAFETVLYNKKTGEDNDGLLNSKLYIKKLNSKTGRMRLHFLPLSMQKWLQIHQATFYHSRLESSPNGQYFVLGVGAGMIEALAVVCNLDVSQLMNDIVSYCKDIDDIKWESVFSYIANGTVSLRFKDRSTFIDSVLKDPDPVIIRDLFIVVKNINVLVLDATDDNCFVRCPAYSKTTNNNCLLVTDENGNYHVVVEVFKSSKNPDLKIIRQFPSDHTVSMSIFKFLNYSCTDKYSQKHVLQDENIVGQILDASYHVKFLVTSNKVSLPVYSNTLCNPTMPIIKNLEFLSLQETLLEYRKRSWIRPLHLLSKDEKVHALVVEAGSMLNEVEFHVPISPQDVAEVEKDGFVIKDMKKGKDNRLFLINVELLENETFMILRNVLSLRLEVNNKLRTKLIKLITVTSVIEDIHITV